MKIKANRKNLKAHARQLLGNEWSEEKEKQLIKAALAGVEPTTRWAHPSHAQAAHLEILDEILGTCGVEGMVEPDVQYCNAGDTYATTLLYYEDELWIGDWGSIVEEEEEVGV
jgi:hypothetical protein